MAGSLLLGVDIGTASTKGVLCDAGGTVLATAVIEHETSFPRPGWVEHDAETLWWGEFVAITRQLTSGPYSGADVGAVGVSAIGPCMVPLDAAGNALRPAILYGIDTRATAEIAQLNAEIGEDNIVALGGMALNSQVKGPNIRWLRDREPELYARTAMVHSSSDYVVFRLIGEHVMDYHTASYYAPLFDIANLRWDGRYAGHVIGIDHLPRLGEATAVAGTVHRAASEATGLPIGTPVTFGTIDAASEAVSVGVQRPGDTMIMYGSTMFFIGTVEHPRPDARMWTTAHPLPGQRAVTCGMSTSGLLTTWTCDILAGTRMGERNDAFSRLIAEASVLPAGSDGLICLPYFAGERTPLQDPDARGMFAGLTLRHTQGHIFRAMLEGIGFGARHNLEVMGEMGAAPGRLVAVGGGTKNRLWTQVVSDITGVPQAIPERTIGASLGDAFMAGYGSGLIDGLDALDREWVAIVDEIIPNPDHAAIYGEMYPIYRDLYEQTKESIHRLGAISTGT